MILLTGDDMNLRQHLEGEKRPEHEPNLYTRIVNKIKYKLFWMKAHRRHKNHAKKYCIIYDKGMYAAGVDVFLAGWTWIASDLYAWNSIHIKRAYTKTRYEALRRLAKYIKYNNNNFERV